MRFFVRRMPAKSKGNPQVDAYISKAPEFAKPILSHLRELVHIASPDVEETMKWSRPHFYHKGMMCGMSAFRQHCSFGFWLYEQIVGDEATSSTEGDGMGQFGKLTSLADLPSDKKIIAYVKKAAALNEAGVKRAAPPRPKEPRELVVPDVVTNALKKNKKAQAAFEAFSYSHKKEYVEWITEAKRDETRDKRIETMMQWLVEGKSRHWKYQNC